VNDAHTAPDSPRLRQRQRWLDVLGRLAAAAGALRDARRTNRLASPAEVIARARELRGWETAAAWAGFAPPLSEVGGEVAALREAGLRFAEVWERGDAPGQWGALVELVACCTRLPADARRSAM
jgi:hypothetical protein